METISAPPADTARWRNGMGVIALGLSGLALTSPLFHVTVAGRVGLLLVLAAALEFAHGFRRSTAAGQRAAWMGGTITLGMGILLLNAPNLASTALVLFLAGWFGLDGARCFLSAFQRKDTRRSALAWVIFGTGNLTICAALLLLRQTPTLVTWAEALAGAARIFGTATSIYLSPVFTAIDSGDRVILSLGLIDNPHMQAIARRLTEEESARATIDRGWIIGFIATLFAIHLGRMGFDRTILGVLGPGFAVLGDLFVALMLAYVIVIPVSVIWRRVTRVPERHAWSWCLQVEPERQGRLRRLATALLSHRLRFSIRLVQARSSFRIALDRGLQIGLPLAAILAATVPVWGMNWYFDTENWAAGVWNNWAEQRTDTWRAAMIAALETEEDAKHPERAFAIDPPGVGEGDFSFLVLGDTGEGDASQHSLRAQYLEVVRRPEVKFVVVSSDVIYPTGAMRDYEANFWLPFMGSTKPIYAIPGNHDWYDALEGFAATFLTPAAARKAMRARIEVDNRLTSTTDQRIEELIGTASRLSKEYGPRTQLQRAPFFQMQTKSFALIAVDTGVARRTDDPESPMKQKAWLTAALEAAKGKTKMVLLGHPFYAGGRYLAEEDSEFARLHEILRQHDVAVVMAGDTHDLEYYAETGARKSGSRPMHHFVNGGGGAYLSFGTSLDWPREPATTEWAYYPSKAEVVGKIEATTPMWKRPAWWWTKRLGGWPFSAEWLSAMFDANVAPFYQSFLEVRVEPAKRRIRYIPYGVQGRLRWSEIDHSPTTRPAGATEESYVEWVVEMDGAG